MIEITDKRYSEIDQALVAFPHGLLQDFSTFQKYIFKVGVEIYEVDAYLKEHERRLMEGDPSDQIIKNVAPKNFAKLIPKCKECGLPLMVEAINNNPRRMIGGTAKSWWVCPDRACDSDPILSDRGPREELESKGVVSVKHHMRKAMRRKTAAAQRRQKRGK